ncbi:NAD(+) diphosphatase [Demequina sp. B12]|uniref:NAD(+) diphosphatase n=1 Tax=Demequina sp. B12 TaxID=2992757 RepID=UPI00237A4573|nr:NAD(+) diphosphatase [Demequina sp. B12]MDE0572566.1 NAD(+) diphosphatase [Demequina sp. B12]
MTRFRPLHGPLLIDRAAHRRDVVDLTQCPAVLVHRGSVAVADGSLAIVELGDSVAPDLRVYAGSFDGRDLAMVVVDTEADAERVATNHGLTWVTLRAFLAVASVREEDDAWTELATTAVALAQWHANHPRCAVCGDGTVPVKGGWVRACESCGREHYPRSDPAMIVTVVDDQDRLLLAHAARWSQRRFSLLAGYVEPGESVEQAVHREVEEEVGVRVTDVEYVASQPWPFPASLMMGFRARAVTTELSPDLEEITEARWMSRRDVADAVAAGEMVPPPVGSIARTMLEAWFGGDLVVDAGSTDHVSDT